MANYKKVKKSAASTIKPLLIVIVGVFIISAAFKKSDPTKSGVPGTSDSTLAVVDAQRIKESKQAFLKAYTVFMNPRCMNCHPDGNQPLQGDDSHIHLQNVTRGPEGKGVFAMKCKNCHQDTNLEGYGFPPGNGHWQMPPANRPMVFQGKSPRELALHFKNNQFTGFKTLNDMIKHVDEEGLVISSFNPPAGVTKIPMSHEEFVATVKEWIDKGAAVPDK